MDMVHYVRTKELLQGCKGSFLYETKNTIHKDVYYEFDMVSCERYNKIKFF